MVNQKKLPSAKQKSRKNVVTKKKSPSSVKVDYYPNRMTVAVSALAGTILVLMAIIAVLGSQ
ncbi:hypothetical protein IPM09_02625 [Candidatus Saccharibacteria bacterium]|nr:MAG: hypothetical protein IPM09_02625 [Candidatus Saccharibacteria bacterium]